MEAETRGGCVVEGDAKDAALSQLTLAVAEPKAVDPIERRATPFVHGPLVDCEPSDARVHRQFLRRVGREDGEGLPTQAKEVERHECVRMPVARAVAGRVGVGYAVSRQPSAIAGVARVHEIPVAAADDVPDHSHDPDQLDALHEDRARLEEVRVLALHHVESASEAVDVEQASVVRRSPHLRQAKHLEHSEVPQGR